MSERRLSAPMVVAATLVTVTTLLLGAFGTIEYVMRRNEEWKRLRHVTAAQTEELAVALAVPVWNIDRPQIEKILESQTDVMPVEAIVITAAGKTHARVRDAQRRFVASDRPFATAGLLTESRTIVFNGERIGTVRLYTTPRFIREQLRATMMRTVAAIVTVDLLLILFVYLVLWRAMLRPVREIERYAGAVSVGGGAVSPPPAPTAELESLRSSIETMVQLLENREQRFRTIFDSVNDAIFIHDRDTGAILDVNSRMCEMFGYTREEARRLDLDALSSGTGPYTQENGVARIRDTRQGDRLLFEWHTRHKDGHLFWVEVSTRAAVIDGVERVVAAVRDVEQRKEMEEALRRSETMSAMGSLVAGVAHEVRNPLFGMSALLDAYADEMTTPDLAELAAGLRQQITRLTHLMRELLELGRPVTLTSAPDSLHDLVAEVIKSHARAAADANVTLRSTIDPALSPVPMDRSRLRQVFENLIDNAVQHAPAVRNVTIGTTQTGAFVECTVEDDGSGFQPADLGRLFEPFFTRRERGIGLGMSIVQRIVEEHGGRVTAGNRAQGGAVITVRLPACQ
ncbi:MAG TPA: ATP-binding protein [Thermoanaerobaculia bacterium]|nr:ATP-binding protein [Thermoanaerobaculia bacterium]